MADRVRVILASGSIARRRMLEEAGLVFDVVPSSADEEALKRQWLESPSSRPLEGLADQLAAAKAVDVSVSQPDAFVIGGDQILVVGGELIGKADNRDGAKATLRKLRGKTHELHSSVALAKDGVVIWRHTDQADMSVRAFSDAWLEMYLDRAGAALTRSVGAYEFEGLGIQLFDKISGDYFTILGMPLLPLVAELRRRGVFIP